MPEFAMPRLSDTMEDGTIVAWLKADGDEVAAGEDLLEVETDKATMTCQAEVGGTLRVLVPEGGTALVGAAIAVIGEGGAATADHGAATEGDAAPGDGDAAPGDGGAAVEGDATTADGGAAGNDATTAGGGAAADAHAAATGTGATVGASGAAAVQATPVARRAARHLGVDLVAVTGSGPKGRVLKADVEAAAAPAPVATAADRAAVGASVRDAAPASPPAPGGLREDAARGTVDRRELTRIEGIVARRMVQAKTDAPEFFLTVDVDMTEAVDLRGRLKAAVGEDDGPVPSFNDFVVRASALALARHPLANGAFVDGAIERYSRVNVGVAVAASGSLLVPTVYDADQKALGRIAAETRRLALAARDGGSAPQDLSGGTFTVSNLGMFGVREFTAVLNPPQAAILAVGRMETRPVWRDDAFAPRSVMTLTLTCDHRILYGADAAAFLAEIRGLLERPLLLAL